MKPIVTPAVRLTAASILSSFRLSGKKHLFLTGWRGAGKSTLLNQLLPLLSPSPLPGITTRLEPGRQVLLWENGTPAVAAIGVASQDGMAPVEEGFLSLGVPALERAAVSPSLWTCIDEIGYLESGCAPFCSAILSLLEKKQVLAVLRKQDTPFLTSLREREDVFLYDLDSPVLPVACMVMASGEGKRFGGNKLMADLGGKPLIAHLLDTLSSPLFAETLVVSRSAEVIQLAEGYGFSTLLHDLPHRNDAIRLGMARLESKDLAGCLFCLGDQPLVTRQSLESMLLSFSTQPDGIYRLSWEGIGGSPILFGREHFPALAVLPPKKGGGWVAEQHPDSVRLIPAFHPQELLDVDTPEDLARLNRYLP